MARKSSPSQQSSKKRMVADRLHSAAIHLLRRLRRVDEATGLGGPSLSALSVVVHAGPITLGDLAAAEQVRPPTMTRIIRELEKGDLIRRKVDQDDRRVSRVQATAKGRRLLKRGRNRRVEILTEWLDGVSNSEFAALDKAVDILERIARPQ